MGDCPVLCWQYRHFDYCQHQPPQPHCCTHPGTGLCMCDCHDNYCGCGDGNTKMREAGGGV